MMYGDIKITMLGGTGSGKTCFMLGMYAIMRGGVRGFTFSAMNPDEDLQLSEDWEKIEYGHGMERFPAGTGLNDTKQLIFKFNYGITKKLADFEWIDYRGGALLSRNEDEDVRILKEHLQESAAVFLCVSGRHFTRPGKIDYEQKKTAIRMVQLLTEVNERTSFQPPIVIVITMHDLCYERDEEELIDEIKELFNPLFVEDSGWLVAICPVTLGVELAEDLEEGMIDPKNIHLPVSFAVFCELKKLLAQKTVELERGQQKLSEYNRKNAFSRWWNSDEILFTGLNIENAGFSIEDAEKKMDLLKKDLIGNVPVYFNGEEIDLDD